MATNVAEDMVEGGNLGNARQALRRFGSGVDSLRQQESHRVAGEREV